MPEPFVVHTKKHMIETINIALSAMDGIPIRLTSKAVKVLSANIAGTDWLISAYRTAWYILNWEYGRMKSDSRMDDYIALKRIIDSALYEYETSNKQTNKG